MVGVIFVLTLRHEAEGRPAASIRIRRETAEWFGLKTAPRTDGARRVSIDPGVWYRRCSSRVFGIAVPQQYPCGQGPVRWSFSVSSTWRQSDWPLLAAQIEASGRPWLGFTNRHGAGLMAKQNFLPKPSAA